MKRTWWLNQIRWLIRSARKDWVSTCWEKLSFYQPRVISVFILMNETLGFLLIIWREISRWSLVRLVNCKLRWRWCKPAVSDPPRASRTSETQIDRRARSHYVMNNKNNNNVRKQTNRIKLYLNTDKISVTRQLIMRHRSLIAIEYVRGNQFLALVFTIFV